MTDKPDAVGSMPDITSRYDFPSGTANDGQSDNSASSNTVEALAPNEVLREARKELARTHIEIAATRAGVDVTGVANYVNMDAFLADDGSVNADAVTAFIESLTPATPAFDQEVTRKTAGSANRPTPRDFTNPQDFKGMTRKQIEALVDSGKLDKLVR